MPPKTSMSSSQTQAKKRGRPPGSLNKSTIMKNQAAAAVAKKNSVTKKGSMKKMQTSSGYSSRSERKSNASMSSSNKPKRKASTYNLFVSLFSQFDEVKGKSSQERYTKLGHAWSHFPQNKKEKMQELIDATADWKTIKLGQLRVPKEWMATHFPSSQ